jgi:predicted RNA methylase
MSKQSKGLKRNTIDKYYTKESVAKECVETVKKYIHINNNDIIIEPSAGSGVFIPYIKLLTDYYQFYDIEPEHPEIILQDYLLFAMKEIASSQKIHVIGNPPFGRQSSIAIKFIKKSCEFASSISFILPKSFKKDSLKRAFPLHFHLVYEMDIPFNSFLVNDVEHDVPCVFQIWQKRDILRETVLKQDPQGFEFVKKMDQPKPDISFRRVGVNAGKIDTDLEKSEQSHYFIRFTNNKPLDENIQNISKIKYEFNNTVGQKSISKQELIKEFMNVLY